MKRKILLSLIGVATPIISMATLTVSCGSATATEHFSSIGKTATTSAGKTTASFTLTLKEAIEGDLTVTSKTTSGNTVNVTSPATISGTNVKVSAEIAVSDLTKSTKSTFDLTFSCDSWTETISGFTINFTKVEYVDVPESAYTVNASGELTAVNIPSGATRLAIPNSVKTIKNGVLKNKFTLTSNSTSSINAIVIPSSVLTIEDEGISGNTALESIDISAFSSIPSGWGSNIFKDCASTGTLNIGSSSSTKEIVYSWVMYGSGLNHNWIKDSSWKCQRYISDRTFSLMATGNYEWDDEPGTEYTQACWGTGWIISDATPNDSTDYTYWIGTNWHVKAGIQSVHMDGTYQGYHYSYVNDTFKVYYGDKSTQKTIDDEYGLHWGNNSETTTSSPCYYCFNKDASDGIWESPSNFRLGKQTVSGYQDAVDFNICKIDFSSILSTGVTMPATIKAKLNNINAWNTQYNGINKLATMSAAKSKAKYVGGFPVDQSSANQDVAKWENHSIAASTMTQYSAYHTSSRQYDMAHTVNDSIGGNDLDFTAQYQFNSPVDEHWMDGGASGSPLITTDLELCGIYWGGQGIETTEEENFIPMFSILNDSSYKDFITSYINYGK